MQQNNIRAVNSGNVCLICGISREEACVSHNDEASVVIEQFNANNIDDESSDKPKKKTKVWLWIAAVVACLCIALLFDRIATATQNTAKDTIVSYWHKQKWLCGIGSDLSNRAGNIYGEMRQSMEELMHLLTEYVYELEHLLYVLPI